MHSNPHKLRSEYKQRDNTISRLSNVSQTLLLTKIQSICFAVASWPLRWNHLTVSMGCCLVTQHFFFASPSHWLLQTHVTRTTHFNNCFILSAGVIDRLLAANISQVLRGVLQSPNSGYYAVRNI